MSIPPNSTQLVKKVPGISETYLKMYKNSQVLVKKAPENGKTVSQLTTYPDGRYKFIQYNEKGKPFFGVENDPEIGARHYYKIGKRGVKTKEKTVYNGLKGLFNCYIDFFNEAGQRIKQVIIKK